jgi:hypothetical protein
MNTTTRRFPRTTNEAFPGSARYANPIEAPPRGERLIRSGWGVIGTSALCLYVVAMLGRWMFP